MNKKTLFNFRLYFTGVVTLSIWTLLLWTHYHGGVPIHHILQRADLPAFSNWWGGLLLPLITWVLLYLVQVRLKKQNLPKTALDNSKQYIIFGFLGSLLFGVLIAVSFTFGFSIVLDNILYVLLILAFLLPIFRAEYILGFIIGMTFTFGVILPTAFALIVAIIGATLYKYIHPLVLRVFVRAEAGK
jgi:hypothetical protein